MADATAGIAERRESVDRASTRRPANLWCRIENFLPAPEHALLFEAALAREAEFSASTTMTGDTGHRRSRLLEEVPSPYRDVLLDVLRLGWPVAMRSLGLPQFRVSRVVAQLTAHGDGDYYRMHDDNGLPSIARRTITFVYFVHREPRAFEGGELAFAGSTGEAEAAVPPLGNSVVFFPSGHRHEVREVRTDGAFASSRFTINGWLYR